MEGKAAWDLQLWTHSPIEDITSDSEINIILHCPLNSPEIGKNNIRCWPATWPITTSKLCTAPRRLGISWDQSILDEVLEFSLRGWEGVSRSRQGGRQWCHTSWPCAGCNPSWEAGPRTSRRGPQCGGCSRGWTDRCTSRWSFAETRLPSPHRFPHMGNLGGCALVLRVWRPSAAGGRSLRCMPRSGSRGWWWPWLL